MVAKFALLSNLLLASAALTSPSSRHGARLAHRGENPQSQPINHIESRADNGLINTHWGGAVWVGDSGTTFTSAKGTFTVPTPSGSSGSIAEIWVGIDGLSCPNVVLQTGIEISISKDGVASYSAWNQWFPDASYYFDNITVAAGHVITAAVIADSTTSGLTIIENWTTGQIVTQNISSSHALCQRDAEWIVEDPALGSTGQLMPFANFGTVTFSSAAASDSGGKQYTPKTGATVVNMVQNGAVLTSVSINEEIDGVVVQYV